METLIISGALANKPFNGGEAWVRLSWILGLRRLGFRVLFVEQIARETCVDATGTVAPLEESINLAWFRQVTEQFGLSGSAALIHMEEERVWGLSYRDLLNTASSAVLLVNISGHLSLPAVTGSIQTKAYIDIDPGFTQFWHSDPASGFTLSGHDFYFTIGENIGRPGCAIPTEGITWRHTRQPVLLEDWPVTREGDPRRFTTIANWRGPFGSVEFGGQSFGLKVHEFRKFMELPQRVPLTFEIALNIHPADGRDRSALLQNGWRLADSREASDSPDAFRRYIQRSGAEFSVAQGIYVATNSGWFSDRTVRYLASGKPALVQDTGFGNALPTGEGLLPFRTPEEAAAGATSIVSDYERHSRAARAMAEEYFASDRVLGRLLDEVSI